MQENLAIATVPIQGWGPLYEAEKALRIGTVFQDLNKPFFAASDDGAGDCSCGCGAGKAAQSGQTKSGEKPAGKTGDGVGQNGIGDRASSPEQQERERMMAEIQAASFAIDDVRLYLDTHPDDGQGLALLKDKLAERKTLLLAYAQKFYPLTADCMADLYENNPASECYCWQKGPMPWEGACV